MNIDYTVEHIGYVTKDINKTANTFKVFGYVAGDIVNDDTQKTFNSAHNDCIHDLSHGHRNDSLK